MPSSDDVWGADAKRWASNRLAIEYEYVRARRTGHRTAERTEKKSAVRSGLDWFAKRQDRDELVSEFQIILKFLTS